MKWMESKMPYHNKTKKTTYNSRNSHLDMDSDYIADWIDIETLEEFEKANIENYTDDTPQNSESKTSKSGSSGTKKKPKITSIHKGHRERVRNKFLQYGFETFTKYEVLELLLFYAIPYKDTNEIAHRLIDKFGSVKAVIDADVNDLLEIDGINEVSASLIVLQRELFKYIHTKEYDVEVLSSSSKSGWFCCKYFMNHVEESFIIIYLDLNDVVKNIEVISEGSENETAFYIRKTVKRILQHRCSKVIIAHNHPGEYPEPSSDDIMTTGHLNESLENIGISLIDHIICSGDKYVSMSDRGLMNYKRTKKTDETK